MYVLNPNSKTIHKFPTREQCNMDQCKEKKKVNEIPPEIDGWKLCRHCMINIKPC